MSVLTLKRTFLAVALLLAGAAAYAGHPSPRAYPRMAFDEQAGQTILFGGESAFDTGTQRSYDSDETWVWGGNNWTQIFPVNNPGGRSAHGMVYDSLRKRIVLFGGRKTRETPDGDITVLNDTWVFENNNWRQLDTAGTAPTPRHLFGMAYDSVRDRVVIYGGSVRAANGIDFETATDTWEFDGTQWSKVAIASEPKTALPLLTYDAAHNQTLMLGVVENLATAMYAYDPAAKEWKKIERDKLPACVNDATLSYRSLHGDVILNGGVCSLATSVLESTWEWDGTNWREVTTNAFTRSTSQAVAYDTLRDQIVTYGGFIAFTTVPNSGTNLYQANNWRFAFKEVRPSPRSLFAFATDPVTNTIWLFGGLNEFSSSYGSELWGYRNGQWFTLALANAPGDCGAPLAAFDTNRSKLVINCGGLATYEFDGKEWKTPTTAHAPTARRFASLVYDESLKKIVLFGGFDGTNYRQDTWVYDGTDWVEVKKDKPENRGMSVMWYDPLQKKTILYGGLGRANLNQRVTRYRDMWSFNGTTWTKMNVSSTPTERFGALTAVDPRSGKLYMFGGLRLVTENNVPRQFYDNELWVWDGGASTWTRLTPNRAPNARQNGGMAWDPLAKTLVMFGGYAGLYYSDTWTFDGSTFTPRLDGSGRRRATGSPSTPATPVQPPPPGSGD